jgi:hypothetical protein
MNMFSPTQSFFKNIPQVDVDKSLNMFGATQSAEQTQSLWGNINTTDNSRKVKTTSRSKK